MEKPLLTDKQKNWIMGILIVLLLSCLGGMAYLFKSLDQERRELDIKDAAVMQLNTELGLTKSLLVEEKELNKKYQQELDQLPQQLKELIDENNLRLQSRVDAVGKLVTKVTRESKGKATIRYTESGETVPVEELDLPKNSVIQYEWEDNLGRFKLEDPDILSPGNETFTAKQSLRIRGLVFYAKDGRLRTQHLDVHEVVLTGEDKEGNPIYSPVKDSKFSLIDAKFEYVDLNKSNYKSAWRMITLRTFGSYDTAVMPGFGIELFNVGRYLDYLNLGMNLKVSADTTDPFAGSLQNSRIGIGLHYHLLPPLFDSNLAVGASVSIPFNDLKSPILTLDFIFFLTQPIELFNE